MRIKYFQFLVFIFLTSLASGCGSLMNFTYDQHEYFRELRDSEIGKNIDEPISEIPESWRSGIIKVDKIDSQNIEYRFTYSRCSWASMVDTTTKLVKSWRFISAPEECKSLKYHQGPW